MKIHTFGIATVAALLISQLSAPLPPNNTATSSYKLDEATFTLNQAGSNLTFEIGDGDPLAIDRILVNGTELKSDAQGNYLFDMGQKMEVEISLSSDSASSNDEPETMRQITSRTFPVHNIGLANIAVAQSTSATRTRIRYQTFIGSDFLKATVACLGWYVNVPNATYFNGNGRTWDANSDSYKTRFDSIIAWGQNPSVSKEVSVGLTEVYLGLPPFVIPETSQRASAESMQLNPTLLSPDYVSFGIKQNVANPFCFGADGINFDLHFYVRRDGVYTLKGNYLPVPFHEVYARDNLDPSWRQIMRSGSENFGCFTRYLGDWCDVNNLEQRSAF